MCCTSDEHMCLRLELRIGWQMYMHALTGQQMQGGRVSGPAWPMLRRRLWQDLRVLTVC